MILNNDLRIVRKDTVLAFHCTAVIFAGAFGNNTYLVNCDLLVCDAVKSCKIPTFRKKVFFHFQGGSYFGPGVELGICRMRSHNANHYRAIRLGQ